MRILFLLLSLSLSPLFAQEEIKQNKLFVVFDCRASFNRSDEDNAQEFLAKNLRLSPSELQRTFSEIRKTHKKNKKSGGVVEEKNPHYEKIKQSGLDLLFSTVQLISSLREKGYSVALLTNLPPEEIRSFKKKPFFQLFHPTILSSHIARDAVFETKVYEEVLATLGVAPENCLFIDEEQEHVDAAKKLGMRAFLFESPELLQKELSQKGLLPSTSSDNAEALQPIATAKVSQSIS